MERRLAAIVCADVAGYSRMMGADEAGTHATFKAHRTAIYPIILNHGGRLVKNTGDGFLLEFPSIVGAIEAAIAMQMVMAERNEHLPADRSMQFRMGIHMGDVMADEDEVFGDDVNIAVRLESVAAPGGVAVSGKACHEAGKRLSVALADAGPHRFKNIDEPIQVWTWQPAGADAGSPAPKAASETSVTNLPAQYRTAIVGVLPFANLSESADEYFSDGLTEDLIHALSLQSFYRVLSRNSTFSFKGRNVSTRLIAREIDATYLIQGSVRRAATKIRVTAELIAPENGEQLWTGRFDRDIGDLFAMQDELTTSLSAAIAAEIYRAEASAPPRSSSNDITAWDRFLKGLSYYYLQTKADCRNLDRPVQGSHRARSDAVDRARLSRHSPDPGHPVRMDQGHARIVGLRDVACGEQRPARSPFVLCVSDSRLSARGGRAFRGGDGCRQAGGRAQSVRYGRPRRAWGLPSRVRRTPARHRTVYDGSAERQQRSPVPMGGRERVRHYLLGQYDASLSWAREQLYVNPNHLQALAIRAAALAQLGRTAEAANATDVLLSNYPGLTVDRHLRNFHWKLPADIAHYRDGLVKAGIPFSRLTLVEPSPKLAADS